METNVARMNAKELGRAISIARGNEMEASARATRESEPRIAAMFSKNAAEARCDLRRYEAALTKLNAGVCAHAAQVEAFKSKPVKARCAHWAAIKAFFAVCREMGLDAQNKAACRAAVGMLLGRRIQSRADLSGAEWAFCTNAVRMGRLFW